MLTSCSIWRSRAEKLSRIASASASVAAALSSLCIWALIGLRNKEVCEQKGWLQVRTTCCALLGVDDELRARLLPAGVLGRQDAHAHLRKVPDLDLRRTWSVSVTACKAWPPLGGDIPATRLACGPLGESTRLRTWSRARRQWSASGSGKATGWLSVQSCCEILTCVQKGKGTFTCCVFQMACAMSG